MIIRVTVRIYRSRKQGQINIQLYKIDVDYGSRQYPKNNRSADASFIVSCVLNNNIGKFLELKGWQCSFWVTENKNGSKKF